MTQANVTTYINGINAVKQATLANKRLAQLKADNTVTLFLERTDNALYFARVSRSNIEDTDSRVECRIRIVEITHNDTIGYHAGSTAYVTHDDSVNVSIVTSKSTLANNLMIQATAKHALHMSKERLGYNDMLKSKYKAMIAEYLTDDTQANEDTVNIAFDDIDDTDE
jgi:type IV secretory pathway VirB9-like protein